jgi:hypothetical protein
VDNCFRHCNHCNDFLHNNASILLAKGRTPAQGKPGE